MIHTPPLISGLFNTGAHVLVVCTGNICRSPAAEILLREHNVFGTNAVIESAGTGAVVGAPIDPPMCEILDQVGDWDTKTHRARHITTEMIAQADVIITMSTKQRSQVLAKDPQAIDKVFTLVELSHLVRIFGASKSIGELHALRSQLPRLLTLDIA
ncbi:MAG: hypothetical protein GX678_07040, partial [Actinomycetales bacterium]|nr:hypothetical protein [Actinomycetales bacterium]